MSADVEIVLERRDDVLRIPTAAVIDGRRVLVLRNGRALSREIRAGLRNWEWTEIASGLSPVIHRSEFVAVMGPSGSGKSTLLNVLGCLDRPTSGRYLLEGHEVQELSETQLADVRRRRIGFIFHSYHLVPRLSAARNV